MLQYLILLLDDDSPSFCYHDNSTKSTQTISYDSLDKTIRFCLKNNLSLNVIYSNNSFPKEYYQLLDKVIHTKIVPFGYRYTDNNSIVIFDKNSLNELKEQSFTNLIFRIKRTDLSFLSSYIEKLIGHFKRLNIVFADLEDFTKKDCDLLEQQLLQLEPILVNALNKDVFEVSLITDRWLLGSMNNCEAGLKHLTIAPNGKFYICPAFYYLDPNESVGDINIGYQIKNQHLLNFDHAPICRNCDSYHCKRCVFLNKITTLEVNIPSSQQCIVAHTERKFSKQILEKLNSLSSRFSHLPQIKEIGHNDPLQLLLEIQDNSFIKTQTWNKTQLIQKNS